jgi:5'(3')-deoxyribonucleotidase
MRIGVDVDGVLADFLTDYRNTFVKVLGKDLFTPVWTTWYFEPIVGYTKPEVSAVWKTIQCSPSFWSDLPALPNVHDDIWALNMVRDVGHEVVFVTARPGERVKLQTERWLTQYGAHNPTVAISSNKAAVVDALDIHLYIDDRIKNLNDVAEVLPWNRVYVFDAPYNQPESVDDVESLGWPFPRTTTVSAMLSREGLL